MKVEAPDLDRGFVLAGRLAEYEAKCVDVTGARAPCVVEFREPASDAISTVLELIERWMDEEQIESAHVELGGRCYMIENQEAARR